MDVWKAYGIRLARKFDQFVNKLIKFRPDSVLTQSKAREGGTGLMVGQCPLWAQSSKLLERSERPLREKRKRHAEETAHCDRSCNEHNQPPQVV